MKPGAGSQGQAEKERVRGEINDQVREFLLRGGRIDVLDNPGRDVRTRLGEVWQFLDDELPGTRQEHQ